MELGLHDRVALVTGASQGIGKAAAILLGRHGARVGITYRTKQAKAQQVIEEIEANGGQAMAVAMDLTSVESVHAAVQAVLTRWERIEILVNNAVQSPSHLPWEAPAFEELSTAEWQSMLRANIEGPYAAVQAVLPVMRARGWGRIVNVSSGIAVDGQPGAGAYAAAKVALHGLTRTLSKELGPAGVLVNVVMPGATLTERMQAVLPAAARAQREDASPIRRLLPPEEVVPVIAFLCSAANTAVNGEIIRASGGAQSA